MKRVFPVITLFIAVAVLITGCSSEAVSIEDHVWKLRTVIVNDSDASVPAVGEPDEVYPEAKVVDVTLTAKDGMITITDATNGKTYAGTYEAANKTPAGTDYNVTIDGIAGFAAVAMTTYSDGEKQPTLPINLGDYSVYFIAQ